MTQCIHIVGIVGSLRAKSYNRMLMEAARASMPETVTFACSDISGLPLFNEDREEPVPTAVEHFKDMVERADAVLIAVPEYNNGVPGPLKNAIDWLSRPYPRNSLNNKVVGLVGGSIGTYGGKLAQTHLRTTLAFMNAIAVAQPIVAVPFIQEKFDGEGHLVDQTTATTLKRHVARLIDLAVRLKDL